MFFPTTPTMGMAHHDLLMMEGDMTPKLKVARAPLTGRRERLMARVGTVLVFAGLDLLERYEPALSSRSEARPTAVSRASV